MHMSNCAAFRSESAHPPSCGKFSSGVRTPTSTAHILSLAYTDRLSSSQKKPEEEEEEKITLFSGH
jgi:hypothetical protein